MVTSSVVALRHCQKYMGNLFKMFHLFFQKVVQEGAVDRLTDTSKYTGSHKERFDESGKGKGIDGRVDRHAEDGYVGGYKNKDTYDQTN